MLLTYLLVLDELDHEDEFVSVYRANRKQMMRIAYGILHDTYDAEDAVHNAFVSIAERFDLIRNCDPRTVSAYCYRAARNSAIDLYGKKYRRTLREDELYAREKEPPDTEGDVLEELASRESFDKIISAIRALPDMYRDVLYLHYVDDLSAAEIARVLARKHATVKKQIVRGKKLLIKLLEEEGIYSE